MNLRQLSIASFNLYNLNEPGLPIYTDQDGWTQAEYDRKIDWAARQLQILKSDLWGFQELWNGASLAHVLSAAGQRAEYELLTAPASNGTRIDCAAIVRKGLLRGTPEWIKDFPQGFVLQAQGDDPQTPAPGPRPRGACLCLPLEVERAHQGVSRALVQDRQGALRQACHRHRCGALHHTAHGRSHRGEIPAF
jgi:hypothetical protein